MKHIEAKTEDCAQIIRAGAGDNQDSLSEILSGGSRGLFQQTAQYR